MSKIEAIPIEDLSVFKSFSPSSQVWIYQSNKKLTDEQALKIETFAQQYAANWQVHGAPARAKAKVLYNYFLIFSVDESTPASGCSIDASVVFVKELEQAFGLNFFDRMQIVYESEGTWANENFSTLKNRIKFGEIARDHLFFNNSINLLEQLYAKWLIPIKDSWLDR